MGNKGNVSTENQNGVVEEVVVVDQILAPTEQNSSELAELTANSLQHFKEEDQKEILRIASEIDVLQLEKVMSYGQIPLLKSFEQAGRILQDEQGTAADREVINQVIELAKKANTSQEEFNIVIREPGFFHKILMKISDAFKDKHDEEVKVKAVSCYKLLEQLRDSCDAWVDLLQDAFGKIELSALEDSKNCYELEQYIVAGYIAQERITDEVEIAKSRWEQTGMLQDKNDYENLKEGLDTFNVVLLNLEKSRAAYGISIGQLMLQAKANKNIQIAVRSQKTNSMALAAQQLRNATLDAKNREGLEGQTSISKLNNELMQKVADNAAHTGVESEKALLNGVYTVEEAIVAAQTVINGCKAIEQARIDRLKNIGDEMDKLKTLVDELAPYINDIKAGKNDISGKEQQGALPTSSSSKTGLQF